MKQGIAEVMETANEYRVKVIVRNNLLLSSIEAQGYTSLRKFADDHGLTYGTLVDFVSLKQSPVGVDGNFRRTAKQLMEILGASPSDLWGQEQLTMKLRKNYGEFVLDKEALAELAHNFPAITGQITHDSPEEALYKKELVGFTADMLGRLTPRERKVIILRWGLDGTNKEHTLDEVGAVFGVTRERIRQIETKAMRRLRHPRNRDTLINATRDDLPLRKNK